jgi:hypothetical protein
VIGVKEAITEAITTKFGSNITNSILQTADGSDFKSVNDWNVEKLMEAIRQGADPPTTTEIHSQFSKLLNFSFNFQHKVQQNYDTLNANTGKLISVGIKVDPSFLGFVLLHQVELAQKHEWGRDFCTAIQTIRKQYPNNYVHDATSTTDMLAEFAGADAVRNLLSEVGGAMANLFPKRIGLAPKMGIFYSTPN